MPLHRSFFVAGVLLVAAAWPARAIDLPEVKIDLQGLPGAAPQPSKKPYLHPHVENLFNQWVAGLDEDFTTLEGPRPLDEKVRELEGNWRYFQSNEHQLRQHPDFDSAYQRMGVLMLKLAALKGAQAVALAERGHKERNPNFFNPNSGISQFLKEAERLVAFAAFKGEADAEYVATKKALADAKATVDRLAANFADAAAAAYRLPPERYSGADKAKLAAMVRSTWKEKYPQDQILALRFPAANWKRERDLKRNATNWYQTDVSSLMVQVVVKRTATLATVYPAYLNKNHMQGDALTVGADTKGSSYVHEDILIKNL